MNQTVPRNANESLFAHAASVLSAYNVYYEEDLRSGAEPTRPAVYLLDANVLLSVRNLPAVAFWTEWEYRAFQVGGPALWHCNLVLDVYAQSRGERWDLAATLVEGMASSFGISDYSSGSAASWGSGSFYENANGTYWNIRPESIGDELSVEGTLKNWVSCQSQFWAKAT